MRIILSLRRFILRTLIYALPVIGYSDWIKINTGIEDDLNSIVFWDSNGVVVGNDGIYVSESFSVDSLKWNKFLPLDNSIHKELYHRTKFYDIIAKENSDDQNKKVYVCGQDTVNNVGVLLDLDLDNKEVKLVYQGSESLQKMTYNEANGSFFIVGSSGVFLKLQNDIMSILDINSSDDFLSVSSLSNFVYIGTTKGTIYGQTFDDSIQIKNLSITNDSVYDVTAQYYYRSFGVSKESFYTFFSNTSHQINSNYYNPLNPQTIEYIDGVGLFVGTNHGVFRSGGYSNTLEWQPSSKNYSILDIKPSLESNSNLYACGKDGVILKTLDRGGATKPYLGGLRVDNKCVDESTEYHFYDFTGLKTCKWYLDDELVMERCLNGFNKYFKEIGGHELKLIATNGGGGVDTAIVDFTIHEKPRINQRVSVTDSIFCRSGVTEVIIDSTQKGVQYEFMLGSKVVGTSFPSVEENQVNSFSTNYINESGRYSIRARHKDSKCQRYNTDSISVLVENTKADFYVNRINAYQNEEVSIYANCKDASSFEWRIRDGNNVNFSNEKYFVTKYDNIGRDSIFLKCFSDHGCSDSLSKIGANVVENIVPVDSCWVNHHTGPDRIWSGGYNPDINDMILSKSGGYFVSGKYYDTRLPSIDGIEYTLPGSGVYIAKYTSEGVLKWYTSAPAHVSTNYNIKHLQEDNKGNLTFYSVGPEYLVDNKGDSIELNWEHNYVTIDKNGGFLSQGFMNSSFNRRLQLGNNNNVILINDFDDLNILYLNVNGKLIDSVVQKGSYEESLNITVLDSTNSFIEHDFQISAERGIGNISINKLNYDTEENMYVVGSAESTFSIDFYSDNSDIPYNLPRPVELESQERYYFVAKYDRSGTVMWVSQVYSESELRYTSTYINGIEFDSLGNTYLSGWNGYNTYFNTKSYIHDIDGKKELPIGGNIFIKIDSSGRLGWANSISEKVEGTGKVHIGFSIKKESEISVLIFGSFDDIESDVIINGQNNTRVTILKENESPRLIAKYNLKGELLNVYVDKLGDDYARTGGPSRFLWGDNGYYYTQNIREGYFSFFGSTILADVEGNYDGSVHKFIPSCTEILDVDIVLNVHDSVEYGTIEVYPNPSKNELSIVNLGIKGNERITVSDVFGKVLINTKLEKGTLNLDKLSSGLYFVNLELNNKVYSIKFIKE